MLYPNHGGFDGLFPDAESYDDDVSRHARRMSRCT